MNGWFIKKIDDKTYKIEQPKKPEITLEQVLALIVIFVFCALHKQTMSVFHQIGDISTFISNYLKNIF
jgi:hypothetical protein